ncbi:interferon-induced very large GTPase 1-like protein [Labeo rohita]|uniref:Interferon-induced very large GTPase 1-like protein n=1 Tax=Labeo rohita TaxID=84645 RepID=A0A498LUK9_LABRO|nr:interferon-induced very large GTPase 1-like protein [Labeo rohita]
MSTTDTTVIVVHNPPRRRRWSKHEPHEMRIVLLGWSVSENSDVGNFILGRAAFDSEAPPDVVERVSGRLKDRHVIIINSPQLLQTNISDHQITQTVRECVHLSDPGPHVIVLLLKHEPCSAEDQERVEKVLLSFSERVYQHTMVLSTRESTETNDILQKIIQKCANRHFSLQTSSSSHDLLQMFEDIEKMNDGRHLDCAEASQYFTVEKPDTEKLSEGVKLNLVVCGCDDTLKSSISEQILQQIDRRSDVDLHGRLINLVELPALIRLSEEEVMRQTLRCVSLCHPGVHVFIIIIPDAPINNEDKAEMEEIQRIFTSRINKHIMILIMQNSERQTAELNEETQSVIQSFGVRHHFIGPKNQVSTLMENIEQMLEENRGEFFSTEMFIEAQMEKLVKYEEMKKKIHSLETHLLSQGLFDTELTNEEIQREIRHCISMILPGPHVFLLLIPLGRFTKEEEKSVKIIQETFGENSLMYTMVLFTRGDFLKKKTIDQCLGKPGSVIRNLIETCGNRFHVFDNNQTGDQTQVTDLLEKIDNMVKANGGSFYSCKMFRQMEREKQEQQMKILMDRVREREEEMKKLEEEKERMKMMMEEERQNQDKERKRREEEFNEREDEIKREREEWKIQKQEENKRREEEDEKRKEKDKAIQRLQSEMEGIIREKERTEREKREQLEDSEKRLKEERNMREDQQKTLEDKLKVLEEQHEDELKRRRVEWREEYEREKDEMMRKICSQTDHSLQSTDRKTTMRKLFDVSRLRDTKVKAVFVAQVRNRFQALQALDEEAGRADETNKQWEQVASLYSKSSEACVGYKWKKKKEWLTENTWKAIDERRTLRKN